MWGRPAPPVRRSSPKMKPSRSRIAKWVRTVDGNESQLLGNLADGSPAGSFESLDYPLAGFLKLYHEQASRYSRLAACPGISQL